MKIHPCPPPTIGNLCFLARKSLKHWKAPRLNEKNNYQRETIRGAIFSLLKAHQLIKLLQPVIKQGLSHPSLTGRSIRNGKFYLFTSYNKRPWLLRRPDNKLMPSNALCTVPFREPYYVPQVAREKTAVLSAL